MPRCLMISIYLRPGKSLFVQANRSKNGTMNVLAHGEFERDYWSLFAGSEETGSNEFYTENPQEENSVEDGNLSDLFYELKRLVSVKNEEIYIVLPDIIFDVIDCINDMSTSDLHATIAARMNIPVKDVTESYCIATPISSKPGTEKMTTVYAIQKHYIQDLINAAADEDLTLSSVEPASLCIIRLAGKIRAEIFILESFENQSSFVDFSLVSGVFKYDADHLAEKALQHMSESEGDNQFKETFSKMDITAAGTFKSCNKNVPISLFSDHPEVLRKFPRFVQRESQESFTFPRFVVSDIQYSSQQLFTPLVGTLLQSASEDELYDFIPPFLSIEQGNLLPKNVQINTRLFKLKNKIIRICRGFTFLGMVLLTAEGVGTLYFSSIEIPLSLKENYAASEQSLPALNNELHIIQQAQKDDQHALEGYRAILAGKPDNCGFTEVKVGGKNDKKNKSWVEFTCVSSDPLVFQDYISSLSASDSFSNVSVTKIDSDPSSVFKLATIITQRGGKKTHE